MNATTEIILTNPNNSDPFLRGKISYLEYTADICEFATGRFSSKLGLKKISLTVRAESIEALSVAFKMAIDEFLETVVRHGPKKVYGGSNTAQVWVNSEEAQKSIPKEDLITWSLSEDGQRYFKNCRPLIYVGKDGYLETASGSAYTLHKKGERYELRLA